MPLPPPLAAPLAPRSAPLLLLTLLTTLASLLFQESIRHTPTSTPLHVLLSPDQFPSTYTQCSLIRFQVCLWCHLSKEAFLCIWYKLGCSLSPLLTQCTFSRSLESPQCGRAYGDYVYLSAYFLSPSIWKKFPEDKILSVLFSPGHQACSRYSTNIC